MQPLFRERTEDPSRQILAMFAMMMIVMVALSYFNEPPADRAAKEGAGQAERGAVEEDETAIPDGGGPAEPTEDTPDPTETEVEPGDPQEAPDQPPPNWVTLGSLDPDAPYRMLVTLTNRGAAVVRAELNSPQYLDLEDRSGYLGQILVEHPDALRDEQGRDATPPAPGCRVQLVPPGTPAEVAGLEAGDLIVRAGETEVDDFATLRNILYNAEPGETVRLTVKRGDQTLELPVPLARRPLEILRPEHAWVSYSDIARQHGLRPYHPEEDDPLSFLVTLETIDTMELPLPESIQEGAEARDDDAFEELIPRDETIRRELLGVHLRDGRWQVEPGHDVEQVTFSKLVPEWGLRVFKTFRLARRESDQSDGDHNGYHLEVEVDIRNEATASRRVAYQLDGPTGLPAEGAWYVRKVGPGWGSYGMRDVVVQYQGRPADMLQCIEIADDEFDTPWTDASLRFLGVDAQYFSCVLLPNKESPEALWLDQAMPLRVGAVPKEWKTVTNTSCRLVSKPVDLASGESMGPRNYTVFAGPKRPELLQHYGLRQTLYYGWFAWVAILLRIVLHLFHDYVFFNYGLAILALTVTVRLSMTPLSRKQAQSAAKMAALQPELQKLNEQYKDDPEARTKAFREFCRKHDYNPAAGCLPLLIQLPIFIGLYRALMVDVELRQAALFSSSIRWCSNLAAPDMLFDWHTFWAGIGWEWFNTGQGMFALGPYFNLLPILTIVVFQVQQAMFMPPATDDNQRLQQNMMKFMMPVIGLLFFKVASGLCLYFLASSIWGIAERKLLPDPKKTAQAKPAESETSAAAQRRAQSAKRRGKRKR